MKIQEKNPVKLGKQREARNGLMGVDWIWLDSIGFDWIGRRLGWRFISMARCNYLWLDSRAAAGIARSVFLLFSFFLLSSLSISFCLFFYLISIFFYKWIPSRRRSVDATLTEFISTRLTELYRVLLGFTGFYWVLLGFTPFYRGLTWFYRVLLDFTEFQWVSPRFTGFYWVLLGFTEFLTEFTGLFQWNESIDYESVSVWAAKGFPEGFP